MSGTQQRMQQQPPYIGSKISLVSKLDIRYEGTLYTVDAVESTIALAKVRSFGTEDRHTQMFVPPREEVYDFIIFKACDIKDLIVCEPPKTMGAQNSLATGLPYDPAIVSISKHPPPEPKLPAKLNLATNDKKHGPGPQLHQQQQHRLFDSFLRRGNEPDPNVFDGTPMFNYRNATKHNVSGRSSRETMQSMEHNNQHQAFFFQGPKTALYHQQPQRNNPFPPFSQNGVQLPPFDSRSQSPPPQSLKFDSDYDFEKANEQFREEINEELKAKLEKVELSEKSASAGDVDKNAESEKHGVSETTEEDKSVGKISSEESVHYNFGGEQQKEESAMKIESADAVVFKAKKPEEEEEENAVFYNKKASFFDNISCDALEKETGKNVRPDWKRERQTNTETFGHSAVRSLFFQRRGVSGRGHGYGGGMMAQTRNNFYQNNNRYYPPRNQMAPPRFQRSQYQPAPQPAVGGGGGAYRRY